MKHKIKHLVFRKARLAAIEVRWSQCKLGKNKIQCRGQVVLWMFCNTNTHAILFVTVVEIKSLKWISYFKIIYIDIYMWDETPRGTKCLGAKHPGTKQRRDEMEMVRNTQHPSDSGTDAQMFAWNTAKAIYKFKQKYRKSLWFYKKNVLIVRMWS